MAHRAQTRGRRPHESTRTRARGVTWQGGFGIWRAHGLVGPAKEFGAVTQMRYRAPTFTRAISLFLLCVGLCSNGSSLLQDTWPRCGRWIYGYQLKSVDTMDSKSTRSPITTRAFETHLSERIKGSPCTAWCIMGGCVEASRCAN